MAQGRAPSLQSPPPTPVYNEVLCLGGIYEPSTRILFLAIKHVGCLLGTRARCSFGVGNGKTRVRCGSRPRKERKMGKGRMCAVAGSIRGTRRPGQEVGNAVIWWWRLPLSMGTPSHLPNHKLSPQGERLLLSYFPSLMAASVARLHKEQRLTSSLCSVLRP